MIARNKKYSDARIAIDGSSFYGCTFDQCTFVFSGLLPVVLEGSTFNDCKWEFDGPARNTIEFMRAMHEGGARDLIEGTIEKIRGKPTKGPTLN